MCLLLDLCFVWFLKNVVVIQAFFQILSLKGVNEVANISAGEEHIFTDFRGPLTTLHGLDYNVIYIYIYIY